MSPLPRHVDFHCHLDLYPVLATAVRTCEASRTATLAVTTTPKAFRHNMKLTQGAEFVRVGLGLHPHLVESRHSEMPLFEGLLQETRYVGEVGLDAGPRFYKSMPQQTEVFRRVLAVCAEHGHKILSVHSVRTAKQILDHVEELLPQDKGTVVLHWFSGTLAEARRAVDLGCYFSVNQTMLEKERGRSLVSALPTERLLTETDGPFIEMNGQPISPGDVRGVVEQLSVILNEDANNTRKLIINNFSRMLSEKNI